MQNEHLPLDRVRTRGGRPLSIVARPPGALTAQRLGRITHALASLRRDLEALEGTIQTYSYMLDTVQGRESVLVISNECRNLVLRPQLQAAVDVLTDQIDSVKRSEG